MNFSKTLLRRALLIVLLAGFTFSPELISHFISKNPIRRASTSLTANATNLHKQEKVNPGLPVRLRIPKISVDAGLDYVALTPQGELGVPGSPNDAAWYDQGPRPGEKGNAVIDGHFGYKNHIPAVFDNLHMLQEGDNLYVEDQKGAITTFVVRDLQTYSRDQADSGVFVSSDGKAHLNLITCEGTWDQTQRSYSNRLIVFADKAT